MGMRELSDHVLAVAENNSQVVTNLQLQKVLFFTIGLHTKKHGIDNFAKELYDIPFHKWRYGPVVEDIYYEYKKYGAQPIKEDTTEHYIYENLNHLIKNLLNVNVFQLVKLSHQLPSWAEYEEKILNGDYVEPYSIEEIHRDFIHEG